MKKVIIPLILMCIILPSCSIICEYPDNGIWFCEELGLSMDFGSHTGKWCMSDGECIDLEMYIGYGHIGFQYRDANGELQFVFTGIYKYVNGEFSVKMFESEQTQEKKYVFHPIKTEDGSMS